jgi:hypothetical protein
MPKSTCQSTCRKKNLCDVLDDDKKIKKIKKINNINGI